MQAVVQLRGEIDMSQDVRDTLKMLNIHKQHHCTFIPDRDTYDGMVTKVHDHVAYGEPSTDVVAMLLRRRGEPATGDDEITNEWVAAHTDYDTVEDLAAGLLAEETTLADAGLSPVLRLHPPRGGHDGIKHPVADGGVIGNHETDSIDDLLTAMR